MYSSQFINYILQKCMKKMDSVVINDKQYDACEVIHNYITRGTEIYDINLPFDYCPLDAEERLVNDIGEYIAASNKAMGREVFTIIKDIISPDEAYIVIGWEKEENPFEQAQ